MKRKGSFWGWRLCLQTSGIFALLPSQGGGRSRSGALRAAPAHGLAPLVGARVASLRCPILRCGHRQSSAKQEPDISRANKTGQVDVLTTQRSEICRKQAHEELFRKGRAGRAKRAGPYCISGRLW